MIISPDLARKIELKRQEMREAPNAPELLAVLNKNELQNMGDTYLFWVGNPSLREACALRNKEIKTLKKMTREDTQALYNGWHYLITHGKSAETSEITPEILKSTNALVNRFDRSLGNYRRSNVTVNIPGYEPPVYQDVPSAVEQCLEEVRSIEKTNPLEAAIYAHLSLTLIQPFDSANKRTARLVQNRMLLDAQLPPASVLTCEAKHYLDLVSLAAQAYAQGDSLGQRPFYDYMAEKVNSGLDKMKGGIKITS